MVQWYPGHMAKAKREVEEKLKLVDIVFELIDSRIPISSRNPMLNDILKNKPRLILMTKCNMADSNVNSAFVNYFKKHNIEVLLIDSVTGLNINKITNCAKEILKEKLAREKAKGLKERAIRCMIVGIPNVGKSTLINKIVNKKVTTTGDKPGVTKAQQWIRIGKNLELLDTPGVLWPKFDDKIVGFNLVITGAIKDEIINMEDIIDYLMTFLKNKYSTELKERYNLDLSRPNFDVVADIARYRGFVKNNEVDYEKTYNIILNDFRNLKFGRITLDVIPNE